MLCDDCAVGLMSFLFPTHHPGVVLAANNYAGNGRLCGWLYGVDFQHNPLLLEWSLQRLLGGKSAGSCVYVEHHHLIGCSGSLEWVNFLIYCVHILSVSHAFCSHGLTFRGELDPYASQLHPSLGPIEDLREIGAAEDDVGRLILHFPTLSHLPKLSASSESSYNERREGLKFEY